MSFSIGLDIGGTKIAGAIFDKDGHEIARKTCPTPADYAEFLAACAGMIASLDAHGTGASIGIGVPGAIDHAHDLIYAPNVVCLRDHHFRFDIEKITGRKVAVANDADCAALSEATDGAGAGHRTVFGVIMGTGVGGGLVVDGRIVEGPNGLTGEWGHVPLPFREDADGPAMLCACGQQGCVEKLICGAGLSRLHHMMTGENVDAHIIGERAQAGDVAARRTLDRFYTVVAKAMVTIIHTIDPHAIIISGGLNNLPGFYDEVPKRWGQYAIRKDLRTKLAPAKHGAMTGLRGAAWLGRKAG